VPLLESGVASACDIVIRFGIQIPWDYKPIVGREENRFQSKDKFSFRASLMFWSLFFCVLLYLFVIV
jgi:hypothetical protein